METIFSLSQSKAELLPHHLHSGIVGQLEIVDTRHDRGKEVICVLRRLNCLPDDCEWWVEGLESCDREREV